MTHRIEVNATTGETKMVEYTADEQAAHDAAVAAQQAAEAAAAEAAVVVPEVVVETPVPPAV
jgi:hypothetical protein